MQAAVEVEGGAMGRVERLIYSTLRPFSPQVMLLDVVCFAGRQKEVAIRE